MNACVCVRAEHAMWMCASCVYLRGYSNEMILKSFVKYVPLWPGVNPVVYIYRKEWETIGLKESEHEKTKISSTLLFS